MVTIHVKQSDLDQFFYETTCDESNDTIIRSIAYINNSRHLIERLAIEIERLGKHGPSKPLDKQGLDKFSETPVEKGEFYCSDPLGRRTGNGVSQDIQKVLLKTIAEGKAYISKDQALNKIPLTVEGIKSKIENLKGAVTIAYPMNIPDYDPVYEMLNDKEIIEGTAAIQEYYDPETCTLWWAGRELNRSEKLFQRIGKNEKTMVVAKLQKKEAGAPMRQPGIIENISLGVTEEERKQMMAKYYRRQEEMKKLQEDDDDTYLNSSWANPKNLKSELHGFNGNIKFK